ncbi:hypothetical protein FHG87_012696 [Trinorchestia longiramus]|nr:hypothetical protein FHG87_012696 [Trinorchestia longiramus]
MMNSENTQVNITKSSLTTAAGRKLLIFRAFLQRSRNLNSCFPKEERCHQPGAAGSPARATAAGVEALKKVSRLKRSWKGAIEKLGQRVPV